VVVVVVVGDIPTNPTPLKKLLLFFLMPFSLPNYAYHPYLDYPFYFLFLYFNELYRENKGNSGSQVVVNYAKVVGN